ncbi:hypothetical protein [Undibacterium sp. TC9W]|uniref:hypothetical protein n=1 Tax=Undibacterium sp. TC9W TaxID=3413053 RepID=UPI003BEFC234
MNVFMKPGFTILGLIAVLTGVAMLYAPDSVKLSCRRGCAFEHQVIMLFGQHTGVSLLGLGIIVIGVYMMWHTLRDGR